MKTKEKLAIALEEAGAPPDMVSRARGGYYDDYESSLDTPCIQLINDCHAAGLVDMAQRAKDGEFDGTLEEGEVWFEREGPAILDELQNG